jgi:hypothetical protein
MGEKDRIFLTPGEVLRAVRIDFKQYGPQFHLFQELCPIVTEKRMIVAKNEKNECVLIKRGKKLKKILISEQDLGDFLFAILNENRYPLPVMAEICRRVFETRADPGTHPASGRDGIWIDTEMERFQCVQCGVCCRKLLYHNDCTQEDYRRWKALGRTDILDRVMLITSGGKITGYRIWVEPGTTRLYPQCPWMVEAGSKNRYKCRIQDVKPEICTHYPYTRKHAVMTGCKGKFIPFFEAEAKT